MNPVPMRAPPPIRWVVVETTALCEPAEFRYALAELVRQLPAGVQWFTGADAHSLAALDVALAACDPVDPGLLLWLQHPWLTLERRCLSELCLALDQHPAWAQVAACDSREPQPWSSSGYATVRGMERFLDGPQAPSGPGPLTPRDEPLLRLVRGSAWRPSTAAGLDGGPRARLARLQGAKWPRAWAHDISGYFAGDRRELLPLVPEGARRFLDVGGGEGRFLATLKAERGAETHLAELEPEVAARALAAGGIDQTWVGDFLQLQRPAAGHFDVISFLDMLEHLDHPELALRHARGLLAPQGRVIASLPNVGHWSVVADLLEGRWDYCPVGIHCNTHLRFFTAQTVQDLFDRAGYHIERWLPVAMPCPPEWRAHWSASAGLAVDSHSLDTYAHLVLAAPKDGP